MRSIRDRLLRRSSVSRLLRTADTESCFRARVLGTAVFSRQRIYLTGDSKDRARSRASEKVIENSLIVAEPGLWTRASAGLSEYIGAWFRAVGRVEIVGRCFRTLRRNGLNNHVVLTQVSYYHCEETGLELHRPDIATPCGLPDLWEQMKTANAEGVIAYCEAELYLIYAQQLQDRVSY